MKDKLRVAGVMKNKLKAQRQGLCRVIAKVIYYKKPINLTYVCPEIQTQEPHTMSKSLYDLTLARRIFHEQDAYSLLSQREACMPGT